MRPLGREDAGKIAIERDLIATFSPWALSVGLDDERLNRAINLIVSTLPVQTIVSAFTADQLLGKLFGDFTRRVSNILLLCFDQVVAGIDAIRGLLAGVFREYGIPSC
jgi:hypothetical protein